MSWDSLDNMIDSMDINRTRLNFAWESPETCLANLILDTKEVEALSAPRLLLQEFVLVFPLQCKLIIPYAGRSPFVIAPFCLQNWCNVDPPVTP